MASPSNLKHTKVNSNTNSKPNTNASANSNLNAAINFNSKSIPKVNTTSSFNNINPSSTNTAIASSSRSNTNSNVNAHNTNSKSSNISNGSAVSEHQLKDAQNLLPHLESLERIIKLPVVGAAWDKSQDVYGKVKGTNRFFNWALSAAENCVTCAVSTTAPIVSKLDRPIQYVDQTLVKGIDKLEVTAPIIKDTPQEIYNQAKNKVIDAVQPHLERVVKLKVASQQKASSLKDLAWQKANEVLATQYGSLAVNGVDTTTALAERLLEYYFPKSDSDEEEYNDDKKNSTIQNGPNGKKTIERDLPVPASEDPVLHTVQTVGRLSNKISRRVYRNVSRQIRKVQKGNVYDYLSSLIAALVLHQYVEQSTVQEPPNVAQTITQNKNIQQPASK